MFEVLEVQGLATVQDLGRRGWRRFGVPTSGPMDAFAFQAANLLVGNSMNAAALEIGSGEITLRPAEDCVIATAGAGYSLGIYNWEFPLWDSCFVRAGWTIRLRKTGHGMWVYLAVAGGIEIKSVLDSASTYLRGRFGGLDGRLLQEGDRLPLGAAKRPLAELAAQTLIKEARPVYSEVPVVNVIPGPQIERFDKKSRETFFSETYGVSLSSDRMGYRLEGPPLYSTQEAELTSEGIVPGAVQVPADGQPIVMMADCATAGGYPKIAAVTSADMPLLAQCMPGRDHIRFRQTTIEAAQERYRASMQKLESGVSQLEDQDW
jgi:antagonist of KipI